MEGLDVGLNYKGRQNVCQIRDIITTQYFHYIWFVRCFHTRRTHKTKYTDTIHNERSQYLGAIEVGQK